MAFTQSTFVLQTPPQKTYSLLMRVQAVSTPEALSTLRRKFSDLEEKNSVEMDSPSSRKRVRYLDSDSDSFKTQYQATQSLVEKVDSLEMVMSISHVCHCYRLMSTRRLMGLR